MPTEVNEDTNRPQVLLVEDQEDNLVIYKTILEHYGYSVITARDGLTGLKLAREHEPGIVLLDVAMPGLDGWQVCRELKKITPLENTVVVILTAHALDVDEKMAFECGADGYLRKPVEPRVVAEEVQRFIGPGVTQTVPL